MERKFRLLLSSPDIPVAMRVRMACSIGAVMGGMPCTSMLDDVPADDLNQTVWREAVRGMFRAAPTFRGSVSGVTPRALITRRSEPSS